MSPDLIGQVIDAARDVHGLKDDAEITLEANPNDVTEEAIAAWRGAGVNRLSLGVQSFDVEELRFLGRDHDALEARRAVDLMLAAFPRSSFDLIYALPGQTEAGWRKSLEHALATGARHLSIYQLTIEPGTAFGRQVGRGDWTPPSEELDAALFELTASVTTQHGLPPYEVSSHAAPGHEAVHNGLYWRGADWFAIGPGAHGRITQDTRRVATEGARRIAGYLDETPEVRLIETDLTTDDIFSERLSGGLRLAEGVPLVAFGAHAATLEEAAAPLIAQGLMRRKGDRLSATPEGRLLLDALTVALLKAL